MEERNFAGRMWQAGGGGASMGLLDDIVAADRKNRQQTARKILWRHMGWAGLTFILASVAWRWLLPGS